MAVSVMQFRNAATAGEGTAYTLSEQANQMDFFDTSSAGSGAFTAFAYSLMYFHDSATAENVTFNFIGGDYLATLVFYNSSTAANGTFTLSGAGAGYGSEVAFVDSSTAGHALFNIGYDSLLVLNDTATADHGAFANAGEIVLYGETLGNAVITNSGSSDPAFGSASLNIYFESTAGDAVITNDGATTSGVFGAATNFVGFLDFSIATAGNATIIASPGSNGGGGGFIYFTLATDGGTSRIELFGNGTGDFSSGTLDISEHNPPGVTIGSLEGSGLVTLGANELTIGSNNLSTLFSGVIEEGQNGTGGSLVKSGMGRLTLSNASTYTGGTTVSEGTLLVTNRTGSATGTSSVTVNGGAFGGTGKVSGALTIGTATTAAILAPGSGKKPGKLTTT